MSTSLLRWSCLLLAFCVLPFASRGASGQGGIVPTFGDVEYANVDGIPLLLDLYLPSTGNGPAPVIVWIHGGGWRAGTKAGGPAARQSLRGYAVASIDYRLSDVATHPAQINDCKAAVRWLRGFGTPAIAAEIAGAEIRDRKLIVTGARLADGAVILVDGAEQKTSNDPASPDTTLVSRKARKRIDRGETVILEIRNPDGETSEGFAYTRP